MDRTFPHAGASWREDLIKVAAISGATLAASDLPADRYTELRGLRFHYLDWPGSSAAPVLVMLHGGGLTAHTWDLVCAHLGGAYRCLALDQRGHGESARVDDGGHTLEEYVADVAAFIERLDLHRVVIVGHSLGGFAGIGHLSAHPERVDGLVLVDVMPAFDRAPARRIAGGMIGAAGASRSPEEVVDRLAARDRSRDPAVLRYQVAHNLRQLPDGRWSPTDDRRHLTAAWFEEFASTCQALDAEAESIACPVLLLKGGASPGFSDDEAGRFCRRLANAGWESVPGAGHLVQEDRPERVATAIERFLSTMR